MVFRSDGTNDAPDATTLRVMAIPVSKPPDVQQPSWALPEQAVVRLLVSRLRGKKVLLDNAMVMAEPALVAANEVLDAVTVAGLVKIFVT